MKNIHSLFYSTFESHERAYRKLRNHEQENIMYQQLQNKTVQDMEKAQTLQALALQRIKEIQEEFKKQKEQQEMLKKVAKESVKGKLEKEVVQSKLDELVKDVESIAFKREFNVDKEKKPALLRRAVEIGGIVDISKLKITRDEDGNIINIEDTKNLYDVKKFLKPKLREHKNEIIFNIPADAKKRGRPKKKKYDPFVDAKVKVIENKQKK
jgi:tyrosyl-tRNA synthetase